MTDKPIPIPNELPILPVREVVLFPGGVLPLKVFEQRYLEMTKVCISEDRAFGVCLIKEGRETGTPAVPESATVWQEIFRATVGQMDSGAIMEPALKYRQVSRKTPRHNH